MYCEHCGAKLENDSKFCAYCGTKVSVSQPIDKSKKTDPKAIAAFVMALVGFIFPFVGLAVGLPAMILGVFAIIEAFENKSLNSRYFAIAAIVVSAIDLVVAIVYMSVIGVGVVQGLISGVHGYPLNY